MKTVTLEVRKPADAMADFSSRGPCADGRIKPDVVAPGTWIEVDPQAPWR